MEQARARADAEQRVTGHMGKASQGEVVGLAGIGLGGNVDVHKLAAAKAMHMGNNTNMSPSPKMHMSTHGAGVGPNPVNGAIASTIPQPLTAQQQQARMYVAQVHQVGGMPSPVPVPMPGTPGAIQPSM